MTNDWKDDLREHRSRKDAYFKHDHHSPLPPDDRDTFDGLVYFPIDGSYRFELEVHEHTEKERVTVGTSPGGEQEYLRWGEFRFELDGVEVTIQAYRATVDDTRLWVPFRDETSGEATYGAGRYLDLEKERHYLGDDVWILDFNEAYNPTCAYSERYECPLPPTENWLKVAIEAGEKAYT